MKKMILASLALALIAVPSVFSQFQSQISLGPNETAIVQCRKGGWLSNLRNVSVTVELPEVLGALKLQLSASAYKEVESYILENEEAFQTALDSVLPPREHFAYLKAFSDSDFASDLWASSEQMRWWDDVRLPDNWVATFSENYLTGAQLRRVRRVPEGQPRYWYCLHSAAGDRGRMEQMNENAPRDYPRP